MSQLLMMLIAATFLTHCAQSDDRDGLEKLDRNDRSPTGFSSGGGGGQGLTPPSSGPPNRGSYQPKKYPSAGANPGAGSGNGGGSIPVKTVEFHIPAGTGKGSWNEVDTALQLVQGDTLLIINDDTTEHRLHTNGAPCPHSPPIPPAGRYACPLDQLYNSQTSGPLYDHNVGPDAAFHLTVAERPKSGVSPPPAVALGFEAIADTIEVSCGGGGCHGAGSSLPVFVGDETKTREFAGEILRRLEDQTSPMPPVTSGRGLSAEAKENFRRVLAR